MDVLVIYQYCTFGGVERLLLNRAAAFKKHGNNVVIHVGYMSDSGALSSFINYINDNSLNELIKPFLISESSLNNVKYDLTFAIDSPQIFDRLFTFKNVFVECHTPYKNNRRYLENLPGEIRGVIVPSLPFKTKLEEEYPNLSSPIVLTNPIPDEFHGIIECPSSFGKRPIVYLARIDDVKNFGEAVEIFSMLKDRKDLIFIVIGEGSTETKILSVFEENGIIENTLFRDKINFSQVPKLIGMVKKANGVFLSPSKGESFGLSAAEFICGGVPVLLSSIPVHNSLVDNDDNYLYEPGNIISAKVKIDNILENWWHLSKHGLEHAKKFRDDYFIDEWNNFLHNQGF